jgi:hypothetical protein
VSRPVQLVTFGEGFAKEVDRTAGDDIPLSPADFASHPGRSSPDRASVSPG